MKILILGNGYIGSNLYKHLVASHDATMIARQDLDYHDKSTFDHCLSTYKPSIVIGCFGFTGRPNIGEAELKKKECWNLNVSIPLMVNTLCCDHRVAYTHISTGCFFAGYDKVWNETDEPNFGMFDSASFYTKSKHAFELCSKHLPNTNLRIRLPFNSDLVDRNLVSKLLRYDNILNYRNSKTCVDDLCSSVGVMVDSGVLLEDSGTYHMVNPNPLTTEEFVSEMRTFGLENPNWRLISSEHLSDLPRSNTCLTTIRGDNPMSNCRPELEALRSCLQKLKKDNR